MTFEYKCCRCGEMFTKESNRRLALKYCPDCRKVHLREQEKEFRNKKKKLAWEQKFGNNKNK